LSVLVLDCSVTMSWFFADEADAYSDRVLASLKDGEAFVPSVWPLEVANAFLVAEKRKRITRAKVIHDLNLLKALRIKVSMQSPIAEIYSLARQSRLSSYDASYLELAMRLGLPLATKDKKLIQAAKKLGVSLL